jgi:ADP-heptose:LPS heptosyltransferase
MGDVLHALPAVAALRRLHPDWFIGWVIDYRWKPLLEAEGCCPTPGRSEGRPIVDRIHEIPTQAWKHKPMTRTTLEGIMRLRRELRAEQYELCIDMQGLIRSALVGSVSGSRRFIGRDWRATGAMALPAKDQDAGAACGRPGMRAGECGSMRDDSAWARDAAGRSSGGAMGG